MIEHAEKYYLDLRGSQPSGPLRRGVLVAAPRCSMTTCGDVFPCHIDRQDADKSIYLSFRDQSWEVSAFTDPFHRRDPREEVISWGKVLMFSPKILRNLTVYGNIRRHAYEAMPNATMKEIHDFVMRSLSLCGLEDYRSSLPGKLSAGALQRLRIAKGITCNPLLMILNEVVDEPGALSEPELRELSERLHEDRNLSTLVAAHRREEETELGGRVLDMGMDAHASVRSVLSLLKQPA